MAKSLSTRILSPPSSIVRARCSNEFQKIVQTFLHLWLFSTIDKNLAEVRSKGCCMPSLHVGDEAVKTKTGKTWHQWFDLLSSGSTRNMDHQEIVAFLRKQYGLGDWWCQMITNAFEQHAGRREQHQRPEGYEISVTKTFPVGVRVLFEHWFSAKERNRWLQGSMFKVTASTQNRSLRAEWADAESTLRADFSSKGTDKSQVVVQHMRLKSLEEAEKMQTFWKECLARLDEVLNKPLTNR